MAQLKTLPAHVALLRGINLGGKNKLPMADLAKMFADAACHEVRTYINSGNVIFRAAPACVANLSALVSARIEKDLGLKVPVVLRNADEMAEVAAGNPFLQSGMPESMLHVMFLAATPEIERVAQLDPERSPGDQFVVRGRDVYLYLPNGVADTKLSNAWLDSKLKTVSTGRNWRTVTTLLGMMRD